MSRRKSVFGQYTLLSCGENRSPAMEAGAKNPAGKSAMLTLERLREVLSYDPETGVWTCLVTRGSSVAGSTAGNLRRDGYRQISIDGQRYYSSRLACFYMTGKWPTDQVDHCDLDPANDRWENLRPATKSQNGANRGFIGNSSGFKGVSIDRRCKSNPFRAYIAVNGNQTYLGQFPTAHAAHAAYVLASKEIFGEFARAA